MQNREICSKTLSLCRNKVVPRSGTLINSTSGTSSSIKKAYTLLCVLCLYVVCVYL